MGHLCKVLLDCEFHRDRSHSTSCILVPPGFETVDTRCWVTTRRSATSLGKDGVMCIPWASFSFAIISKVPTKLTFWSASWSLRGSCPRGLQGPQTFGFTSGNFLKKILGQEGEESSLIAYDWLHKYIYASSQFADQTRISLNTSLKIKPRRNYTFWGWKLYTVTAHHNVISYYCHRPKSHHYWEQELAQQGLSLVRHQPFIPSESQGWSAAQTQWNLFLQAFLEPWMDGHHAHCSVLVDKHSVQCEGLLMDGSCVQWRWGICPWVCKSCETTPPVLRWILLFNWSSHSSSHAVPQLPSKGISSHHTAPVTRVSVFLDLQVNHRLFRWWIHWIL